MTLNKSFPTDGFDAFCIHIKINEYNALRAEILSHFQNRNTLLTLGITILGIILATLSQDKDTKIINSFYDFLCVCFFIPVICNFIISFWLICTVKIARIGQYLGEHVEDYIFELIKEKSTVNEDNSIKKESPLYWENFIRCRGDRNEISVKPYEFWQASSILLIFQTISWVALGMAVWAIKNEGLLINTISLVVGFAINCISLVIEIYLLDKVTEHFKDSIPLIKRLNVASRVRRQPSQKKNDPDCR